jgi:hypothetical protein
MTETLKGKIALSFAAAGADAVSLWGQRDGATCCLRYGDGRD